MVSRACLSALAFFQAPGALEVLCAAIKESKPAVRAPAAWALAAGGVAKAVGLLREALQDPLETCYESRADDDWKPSLSCPLSSPVYPVRNAAADAIRSPGSPEARRLLPDVKAGLVEDSCRRSSGWFFPSSSKSGGASAFRFRFLAAGQRAARPCCPPRVV